MMTNRNPLNIAEVIILNYLIKCLGTHVVIVECLQLCVVGAGDLLSHLVTSTESEQEEDEEERANIQNNLKKLGMLKSR